MKIRLVLGLVAMLPAAAIAAEDPGALARWQADPSLVLEADDLEIEAFHWLARPVVVFADSPADPRYREQMQLLTARLDELADRDVVIITDTDPQARSPLRQKLRPRGFMLVLIGKDGGVKLRKPFPWDVREITRSIDKTPLRQQEIRDRAGGGG
ncbi:hypothetical protein Ga0609869_000625 [Rhodovulum iodosum]|uniref:DUF4174 domain-containing protein n=1 Tax=Rhodovulum iodosum TaxID=68291 RepID=A0ABV3XS52_9RHOB|nr:DUF4174 domain-containing protein [Rhodovulum robiginosum]RSK31438.1 DUF4174 domain-containing protein [Rhodovulum robiginosum]